MDVKIPKGIQDINKNVLKNEIDYYNGNEYIENLKKSLNVNNLLQGTN